MKKKRTLKKGVKLTINILISIILFIGLYITNNKLIELLILIYLFSYNITNILKSL